MDFLNHFRRSFIVSYADLTQHPAKTLEAICDRLDIPYFEGKEHFWKGVSHHLFGADSLRLQFYDKTGERFSKLASSLRDRRRGVLHSVEKHKTIYHVEEWREKLPKKYHELPDHVLKMFGVLEEEKIRI